LEGTLMRRLLTAAFAFVIVAPAAPAQESQTVPLGTRVYDVFELSPAEPVHVSTVLVPGAAEMVIDVHTRALPVGVEVRDPAGVLVDPASYTQLSLGPADVPPLGALFFEEGLHVQVAVTSPMAGPWTVRATLPAGSPATFASVTAFMAGGLGVSAVASRATYFAGDTAVIGVLAFDGTTPVVSAAVTANVYQEGAEGSPIVVTLLDDGVEPDVAAGDGLYSAQLASLPVGHYLVEALLVSGSRQATAGTDFEVAPRLARFTGVVSDAGVDTNADGLFEHVALQLEVEVETPGHYAITAVLRSGAATLVAGTQSALPEGTLSLDVAFTADAIRKFLAADGPYAIAEVVLTRLGDAVLGERVADRRSDLGSTQAYTLSQLQRPITIVRPGLTDAGVDMDADGLFDYLRVSFDVDTRQPGGYTWTGDLRASDGTILGVASGQGFLDAGVTRVDFLFPGLPIGESGQDGPYVVGNVAVYGPPNAATVVDELGRTQPYLVSQFEGSQVTFAQLVAAVEAVPITSGHPSATVLRKVLLVTVKAAQFVAEHGHPQVAEVLLNVFIRQVEGLRDHGRIAPADAARLIDLAARLIGQL
jgi:hypothetical protein